MSDFSHTKEKVILALDGLNLKEAIKITKVLGNRVYAIKIHDLLDRYGPGVVMDLKKAGAKKVWVDYKLHDIPNTVRLRVGALGAAGADIVSIHISGGSEMIQSAKGCFGGEIYGVTLLTALDEVATKEIYNESPNRVIYRLALF